MGLLDTIKTRVKKGTDTVLDTTSKVGNYMEEKSATLVEKVPGGHDLKEKAAKYTEKAVDRVGHETKDMIKEGHEFIESHMKKEVHTDTATKPGETAVVLEAKKEESVVIPATAEAQTTTPTSVVSDANEEVKEEKKVVAKKTHTTKKAHPHTKK